MVQARLDSAFGTSNFFSAGYEFEREQYYREVSDVSATVTIDSYSHALYAQDRIELLDSRLQLSFGGRAQTFNLPDPVFVGGSHPYGDANFEAPSAYTGDAALACFFPDSGTKLRVHVGNSYRAPSPFERFGGSFSSFSSAFSFWGDPRLKPEQSVAFDGGIDPRAAGDGCRCSVARRARAAPGGPGSRDPGGAGVRCPGCPGDDRRRRPARDERQHAGRGKRSRGRQQRVSPHPTVLLRKA